jgi:two-component system chemotaxis response regulator CheB
VKARVLIVDDSAFMRKALRRMIEGDDAFEVVGVAQDGSEGVRMAAELKPDIVTLDVKMPVMDGLVALERILADRPVPVLMLSSVTSEGAETTLRALELGALDFIDKSTVSSSMDIVSIAPVLLSKLKLLASITQDKISLNRAPVIEPQVAQHPAAARAPVEINFDLVVIGASTGGPSCIQALLTSLPKNYPLPVVVVQHMPVGFTRSLAERLNSICAVEVIEGRDGDEVRPGRVVIAPAGHHLLVRRREGGGLYCALATEPVNALHRPSVDVLFASTVKAVGNRALGVLLTGMGKDGARGLLAMRQAGCETIAQDEKSSVVWGMPRAAVELGAAQAVLPLSAIRFRILEVAGANQ